MHTERCPSGQREQTVNLPAYAFEGSNPSLSTTSSTPREVRAGIAQLARARAFQARGRGFESRFPLQIAKTIAADVAQSVERILGKDEVTSSILVIGSTFPMLPSEYGKSRCQEIK